MTTIRVPLDNGMVLEFPEGTAPAVIEAAKEKFSAAPPPTSGQRAMTSVPGRLGMGAVMDRIDPMAEGAARGAQALGVEIPGASVSDVQSMNKERRGIYEAARAATGQEGMDIARMLGPLPLDIGVTKAIAPKLLAAPRTTSELAKSGAVVGGGSAAMAPVKDSEGLSNIDYALEKLKQTGIGTGLGAVITPVAAPLTELALAGVGRGAAALAQKAKSLFAPNVAQEIVKDASKLDQFLAAQAKQVGVDFAAVPENVRDSLRQAAVRATTATGKLPAAAIQNRLIAEKAGLPQLTVGQATRDPVQFSREANLADEEFRQFLGGQQTAATQALKGAQGGLPGEATPYVAGSEVIKDLAAQRKVYDDKIRELYDTARNDPAGYQLIQNTRNFAKETIRDLKKQQLWGELPTVFQKQLNLLTVDSGRYKLSARQAADLLKNINAQRSPSGQEPKDVALGVLKTRARELLDNAEMRNPEEGARVIGAFKEASKKRAERGQWEEKSTAIENLSSKSPIAPERVYEKYVASGSVDDLKGLWSTLGAESKQLMQRQFINDLVNRAMNRSGTELTNYSSALKWMRDMPKEKLNTLFPNKKDLQQFKNILEYVRLTKEAPPGNFVNRSQTGVMLMDAIASARNLPVIGPMVAKPFNDLRAQRQAAAAQSGAVFGEGEATAPLPVGALQRLGAQAVPFLSAPLASGLSQ
jgi:hypothetical protein